MIIFSPNSKESLVETQSQYSSLAHSLKPFRPDRLSLDHQSDIEDRDKAVNLNQNTTSQLESLEVRQ